MLLEMPDVSAAHAEPNRWLANENWPKEPVLKLLILGACISILTCWWKW